MHLYLPIDNKSLCVPRELTRGFHTRMEANYKNRMILKVNSISNISTALACTIFPHFLNCI
jgi:hypothetical protein